MPQFSKTTIHARRLAPAVAASMGALAFVMVSFSSVALADTKQECVAAYDKVQDLRDAGKLEEGILEAQICAREVCSKAVREDCAQWKIDLEARESTIVVEVVDGAGRPVDNGAVSLDGAPWLEHLDGSPHLVSQGPHTLEVTVTGFVPRKQSIAIQEGEKNRKITITVSPVPPPPRPPPPPAVHRIGPWVVGGVGAAAIVGGAVTGGVVVGAYNVMKDQCNDTALPKKVGSVVLPGKTCTKEGFDAERRGRALGPATTVLLVGGGALVAAGVIWLVAGPHEAKPASSSFFVVPVVSSQQTGVVLGGDW